MTLRIHPDEIVESSTSPLLAIHPSWERARLGQVADVLNGFAFKSEFFSHDEGAPLLRIRDVGQSSTNVRYVGAHDSRYLVHAGDIVVGMDGDFRVARWKGPPALLNQRVCKITVHSPEIYDLSFLLYALPGYLDAINAHTSSITVKHLSSRTIEEIPLPLPPLNEQRLIVAAIEEPFSRLDAADELLRRATLRLKGLRRAVLSRVVSVGDSRSVGALLERIEAGKSFRCHGRPADDEEWGVIKVSAMTWGSFDERENKAVLSSALADPRWEVKPGDLLLSRANTTEYVGASVLVDRCRPRLLLSAPGRKFCRA